MSDNMTKALIALIVALILFFLREYYQTKRDRKEKFREYFLDGCLDKLNELFAFYFLKYSRDISNTAEIYPKLSEYGSAIARFNAMASDDYLLIHLKILEAGDQEPSVLVDIAAQLSRRVHIIRFSLKDYQPDSDFDISSLAKISRIKEVLDAFKKEAEDLGFGR